MLRSSGHRLSVAHVLAVADNQRARMVAVLRAVLRNDADSVGAVGIPLHLLLLSRRVLQRLVGRSAVVRCGRASQDLLGRAQVAAADPERPSLFPVLRDPLHLHPGLRRLEGTVVRRPQRSRHAVRHRTRIAGPDPESDSAGTVHVRVPFPSAPDRRTQGRAVGQPDAEIVLRLRLRPQSKPHAVGLDQHVLRGLCGSVHPPVRHVASGRIGGSSKPWRTIRFTNSTFW